MRLRRHTLAAAAFLLVAGASAAEEPVDADARIAAMRASSRQLAALADEPLPAFRSPAERQAAEDYRGFLARASGELEALAREWETALVADRSGDAAGGDPQTTLMNATRQMQETNMGFNLQYLALQQKLQNENRQFTALSNIMKTKRDTAKNAISNVR